MKPRSVLIRAAGLLFAAVVPSLASSQTTIQLEGMLKSSSGEAVPVAQVTVTDPATNETRKATSTSSGQFRVLGLYPGRYTVSVKALGYAPASQDVELIIGQRANIVFTLEKAATELGAVEVRSEHMVRWKSADWLKAESAARRSNRKTRSHHRSHGCLGAVHSYADRCPLLSKFAPPAER